MAYDGKLVMVDEEIDSRGGHETARVAYLPHSCDKWVIGNQEQVKAMIGDLQDALRHWDDDRYWQKRRGQLRDKDIY